VLVAAVAIVAGEIIKTSTLLDTTDAKKEKNKKKRYSRRSRLLDTRYLAYRECERDGDMHAANWLFSRWHTLFAYNFLTYVSI